MEHRMSRRREAGLRTFSRQLEVTAGGPVPGSHPLPRFPLPGHLTGFPIRPSRGTSRLTPVTIASTVVAPSPPSAVPAAVPSTVTVVGIGADGWTGLSALGQDRVRRAEVLVAGPRVRAMVPEVSG